MSYRSRFIEIDGFSGVPNGYWRKVLWRFPGPAGTGLSRSTGRRMIRNMTGVMSQSGSGSPTTISWALNKFSILKLHA